MLKDFRANLLTLNQQIFDLLKSRKDLVQKIQATKNGADNWDLKREVEIFSHFNWQAYSLQEVLMISLMIESHAASAPKSNYPHWSERVHIKKAVNSLIEQINPVILYFAQPEQFKNLELTDKFKNLSQDIKNISNF